MKTRSAVEPIARQFSANTDLISVEPYSGGIINQTWLATTHSARFILQRINPQVFPNPQKLISNLVTLLAHVQQQKHSGQTPRLKFPELLASEAGKPYVIDTDGSTWRALSFIENTHTLPALTTETEAQQVGFALGQFHRQVHDLNPDSLYDTLPGFHNAPDYFKHYQQQLDSTKTRLNNPQLSQCQRFVEQRQNCFEVLEHAKQQNLLHTRPIHGDPKLANILFDLDSGQAVALIDLDTVMPGLIHYDIGDCLRSCCNTAKQAENNSQPAEFDFDVCKLILTRYLDEAQTFLTRHDYQYLYDAIHLIPLELGLRYLSDYLAGNRYFSVDTPDQNLHRAIQQFELTASIERQQLAIQQLIQQNTPVP